MSDSKFGKWWPCLKKHRKRLEAWLPHAQRLKSGIDGRDFRYFTFCAREMIDIYLLVKEKVLTYDEVNRRVVGVTFCECDEGIFPEMKELVGPEESGFLAFLEEIVLFEDLAATVPLVDETAIARYLSREGGKVKEDVRRAIELKLMQIKFRKLFPFDFLNLDFCDGYYKEPPDVLKIHRAIDRILEWQGRPGTLVSGAEFALHRFTASITCRLDDKIPLDAVERLKAIVDLNRDNHGEYGADLSRLGHLNLGDWRSNNLLDFFMASWPKEIARLAYEKGWNLELLDHVFYDRVDRNRERYYMVCLVLGFEKTDKCTTYLQMVRSCLEKERRKEITKIDLDSNDGQRILNDLRGVVKLRNEQARYQEREALEDPLEAILRRREEGIQI
jgi:hypothetical protein